MKDQSMLETLMQHNTQRLYEINELEGVIRSRLSRKGDATSLIEAQTILEDLYKLDATTIKTLRNEWDK